MEQELVVTSSIRVGPPDWLYVPAPNEATDAWHAEALSLLEAVAEADGGRTAHPSHALDELIEFSGSLGGLERIVAGLQIPRQWPLPVVVSIAVSDPEVDLLELAGANGGLPASAPLIEELPEQIGYGPLVTRFDLDDAGVVMATVCAVRRDEVLDTRVFWRTPDLGLVPRFTPALLELLASIRNEVAS